MLDFDKLREHYRKEMMLEAIRKRPNDYVQFSSVKRSFDVVLNNLESLFTNYFEQVKTILLSGQMVKFNSLLRDLSITIETKSDEKDLLADFNPIESPYVLSIYLNDLKVNEELTKDDLINYLRSDKFQTLLFHEITHYEQTILYGDLFMTLETRYLADLKNYQSSPLELEACIFMMIENAKIKGVSINSLDELISYAKDINEFYLITAKNIIMNNQDDVKDVMTHNNFTEQVNEELTDLDNFEFKIEALPPRKGKHVCLPPYK